MSEDKTKPAFNPEDAKGTIERRQLSKLIVDPSVQRSLVPTRVEAMAASFDYAAFGTPCVSARKNGTVVILDGQHRIEARRLYNSSVFPNGEFADEEIEVEVFYNLTPQEEAEIFLGRNNTRPVTALSKFLVRLTAEDPIALGVRDLIKKHGWSLGNPAEGFMTAVSALERAYNMNQWALDMAIATATGAWGHQVDAGDGRIIAGLAKFYDFHGTAARADDVVNKLKASGTPAAMIGRATTLKAALGCTPAQAVAQEATNIYNSGRRVYRLEAVLGAKP